MEKTGPNPAATASTDNTTPVTGGNVARSAANNRARVRDAVKLSLPSVQSDYDESVYADLQLQIDNDGRVTEVSLIRGTGYPALDRAIRQGIRRYRFWPAEQAGQPVASTLVYRYQVNLKETEW